MKNDFQDIQNKLLSDNVVIKIFSGMNYSLHITDMKNVFESAYFECKDRETVEKVLFNYYKRRQQQKRKEKIMRLL